MFERSSCLLPGWLDATIRRREIPFAIDRSLGHYVQNEAEQLLLFPDDRTKLTYGLSLPIHVGVLL